MKDKMHVILEEKCLNKLRSNLTLVILKINFEDSPSKYEAVLIEDEVFLFSYDFVKAPGFIQIDAKDSKQKSFVGKQLIFLPKGDKRIINPIRMYSCIYY